jgi:hypothetical protein
MEIRYGTVDVTDLRGLTLADVLINVEADLEAWDGDRLIYSERSFPIVELARALGCWIHADSAYDFEFSSLSFEESGVIEIHNTSKGWYVTSIFTPTVRSRIMQLDDVRDMIAGFVENVKSDLEWLGLIDIVAGWKVLKLWLEENPQCYLPGRTCDQGRTYCCRYFQSAT